MRRPALMLVLAALVGALVAAPVAVYASHSFNDVPPSNTFHADIAWLADAGVTRGCNPPANSEFCPDDPVTREQMAAFMRRLAQYFGAEDGTPAQADTALVAQGVAPGAVRSVGLRNGAVTSEKIATRADGVVLAAGIIGGSGSAQPAYNRLGEPITAERVATGNYRVTIPGASLSSGYVAQVTTQDSLPRTCDLKTPVVDPETIRVVCSAASSGSAVDTTFHFTLFHEG